MFGLVYFFNSNHAFKCQVSSMFNNSRPFRSVDRAVWQNSRSLLGADEAAPWTELGSHFRPRKKPPANERLGFESANTLPDV